MVTPLDSNSVFNENLNTWLKQSDSVSDTSQTSSLKESKAGKSGTNDKVVIKHAPMIDLTLFNQAPWRSNDTTHNDDYTAMEQALKSCWQTPMPLKKITFASEDPIIEQSTKQQGIDSLEQRVKQQLASIGNLREPGPIQNLPNDLMANIFKGLTPTDQLNLAQAMGVRHEQVLGNREETGTTPALPKSLEGILLPENDPGILGTTPELKADFLRAQIERNLSQSKPLPTTDQIKQYDLPQEDSAKLQSLVSDPGLQRIADIGTQKRKQQESALAYLKSHLENLRQQEWNMAPLSIPDDDLQRIDNIANLNTILQRLTNLGLDFGDTPVRDEIDILKQWRIYQEAKESPRPHPQELAQALESIDPDLLDEFQSDHALALPLESLKHVRVFLTGLLDPKVIENKIPMIRSMQKEARQASTSAATTSSTTEASQTNLENHANWKKEFNALIAERGKQQAILGDLKHQRVQLYQNAQNGSPSHRQLALRMDLDLHAHAHAQVSSFKTQLEKINVRTLDNKTIANVEAEIAELNKKISEKRLQEPQRPPPPPPSKKDQIADEIKHYQNRINNLIQQVNGLETSMQNVHDIRMQNIQNNENRDGLHNKREMLLQQLVRQYGKLDHNKREALSIIKHNINQTTLPSINLDLKAALVEDTLAQAAQTRSTLTQNKMLRLTVKTLENRNFGQHVDQLAGRLASQLHHFNVNTSYSSLNPQGNGYKVLKRLLQGKSLTPSSLLNSDRRLDGPVVPVSLVQRTKILAGLAESTPYLSTLPRPSKKMSTASNWGELGAAAGGIGTTAKVITTLGLATAPLISTTVLPAIGGGIAAGFVAAAIPARKSTQKSTFKLMMSEIQLNRGPNAPNAEKMRAMIPVWQKLFENFRHYSKDQQRTIIKTFTEQAAPSNFPTQDQLGMNTALADLNATLANTAMQSNDKKMKRDTQRYLRARLNNGEIPALQANQIRIVLGDLRPESMIPGA